MASARIILAPPAVARLAVASGPVLRIAAPAPALVKVISDGVQGPRGAPGADAVIPDPGDLTIYLENGMI